MMGQYINIKALTLEELTGVINLYPWYAGARKELCLRMVKLAGNNWGKKEFADASLYIGSRKIISNIYRLNNIEDYSDKDVNVLVKAYIQESPQNTNYVRTIKVIGGDYFSQSQYDEAKQSNDNIFINFAKYSKTEKEKTDGTIKIADNLFTETLAKIYLSQGYYEQAKNIYSTLLLKFPEKNAYFASLIAEIDKMINN